MNNVAFLLVMFAAPVGLLFYSLAGQKQANAPEEFLYGGLTIRAAIYSTIGTVLGAGFTVGLIMGATGFFGWFAGIAILSFLVLAYPAILYVMLRSPAVRSFYRGECERVPCTLFSFLVASDAEPVLVRFTATYMVTLVLLYAFVEFLMCYAVLHYIYGPYLGVPWLVYAILALVVISYVAIGGYPAVLRTDRVQLFTTVGLIVFITALVWSFHGGSLGVLESAAAAPAGAVDGPQDTGGLRTAELTKLASSFALVVAAGAWLLTAPDMFFRLSRVIYGFPGRSGVLVETTKAPGKMFSVIALLFLPVAGVTVLLGLYGAEPVSPLGSLADREYGEGTQWTLSALLSADSIVSNPGLGILFPALFLLLMSLAFMSTIDTAIITAMQVHADYRFNRAPESAKGRKGHIRRTVVGAASLLAVLPPVLSAIGEKWFLGTAANFGFGMSLLSTGLFCIFVARALVPSWAPRRKAHIVSVWLGPLVVIGCVLLLCKYTGAFPGAEPGELKVFSNIGLVVALYFATYAAFVACAVVRDSRARGVPKR